MSSNLIMKLDKPFHLLRCRLVLWYTTVMGLVLGICGFALYEAIARTQWLSLEQEMESTTETLHEQLIPVLRQPGHLDAQVQQRLPGICVIELGCVTPPQEAQQNFLETLRAHQDYLRLLDSTGHLVAYAGDPPINPTFTTTQERWQTVKNSTGDRYRQVSLPLRTEGDIPWGTLQVGHSLQTLDHNLASLRLIFLLGLPLAILLAGGASYWLTHLAMQPTYQSYQQMQQFTADAAHELRTPLASTLATVDSALRLKQMPETEARDLLQIVRRQTLRLTQLAGDLLLLSYADRQALTLEPVRCCLQEIVTDLTEEFGALAVSAGLTLSTEIRISEPLWVLGNGEQLYRLFANLINNAIKYTPKSGSVTVTLDRLDGQALIQVEDTGIGITPEDQSRIFDQFYRVNPDRSRQTGGTGLGLPIALAIAQAHGGSLKVRSKLNEGSTFTVQLPLQP